MGIYFYIMLLVVVGIILLWIGYSLYFGPSSPFFPAFLPWKLGKKGESYRGAPGDPQVCPICSMQLVKGELVRTVAFPSITGGADRLMYIRGCFSCMESDLPRRCPICKTALDIEDYLISRMFERRTSKNHVHVLGCNHCKPRWKM